MKRWHEEEAVTRRQWQRHRRRHVQSNKARSQGDRPGQMRLGSDPYAVDCRCDEQPGRFRKHHAYDCGLRGVQNVP